MYYILLALSIPFGIVLASVVVVLARDLHHFYRKEFILCTSVGFLIVTGQNLRGEILRNPSKLPILLLIQATLSMSYSIKIFQADWNN